MAETPSPGPDPGRLNRLKQTVFYELLETVGRVFIVIRHSERVRIGRRGFLPEEMERGLVLVINPSMKFSWEDGWFRARLVFGQTPEDCVVPEEDIVAVHSPEARTQLVCETAAPAEAVQATKPAAPAKKKKPAGGKTAGKATERVVQVDFTKKKSS